MQISDLSVLYKMNEASTEHPKVSLESMINLLTKYSTFAHAGLIHIGSAVDIILQGLSSIER